MTDPKLEELRDIYHARADAYLEPITRSEAVRWNRNDRAYVAALEQELKALRWMLDECADDRAEELSIWENADASPPFDLRVHSQQMVLDDLKSRWTRREP